MTYYTDIYEMPIYNFFKVMSYENFGFLHKDSTNKSPKSIVKDESDKAVKIWHDLNNQYMDEFGQDEKTFDLLDKKRDLGMLKTDFIITGDKFKLTLIELKELEIKTFENQSNGEENVSVFNANEEIGVLSKYLGQIIDVRKTSVHQYYTLKNNLKAQKN